jgi:hypothetical protein
MKMKLDINDDLLERAKKLSGIEDENALINTALQLFVTMETQKKLMGLYGKIEMDDEAFK